MTKKHVPFRLGLTGSIGMGKSTTAQMFADRGIPVWDADAAVHELYSNGGKGTEAVKKLCPPAVVGGAVDRTALSTWATSNPENLKKLEAVIHPLVSANRSAFVDEATSDIVLLDIPLLFEADLLHVVDAVAVVNVADDVQRHRVLAREGMTEEKFKFILEKQLSNLEKVKRADFVIDTSTLEAASKCVDDILIKIRAENDA